MKLHIPILFLLLSAGCGGNREEPTTMDPPTADSIGNISEISLSDEQIKLAGIETTRLEKRVLSDVIEATGTVEVPPQYRASVHVPMGGFVKELRYTLGEEVQKGAVLAVLEHPDYIRIQQEYLESRSRLTFLEKEYERTRSLALDSAASQKRFQEAEAAYMTEKARQQGLAAQLTLLGIEADKMNGVRSTLTVTAPISGYLTEYRVNRGVYVNQNENLFEITDTRHLRLLLQVYAKDLPRLKIGQKVLYHMGESSSNLMEGTIFSIVKKVDEQNRTVQVYADIKDRDGARLVPGMFLRARILVRQEPVYCLPSEGVITENRQSWVFIRSGNIFRKILVDKGTEQEGFTEILHAGDDLLRAEVVTRGAYNVNAEMNSEEE